MKRPESCGGCVGKRKMNWVPRCWVLREIFWAIQRDLQALIIKEEKYHGWDFDNAGDDEVRLVQLPGKSFELPERVLSDLRLKQLYFPCDCIDRIQNCSSSGTTEVTFGCETVRKVRKSYFSIYWKALVLSQRKWLFRSRQTFVSRILI